MSGLVVLLVGIATGSLAVRQLPGPQIDSVDQPLWMTLLVTFVTMTGLSVWGPPQLRRVAVLAGMMAGFVYASFSGVFSAAEIAAIGSEPLLAIPRMGQCDIAFDPKLITPFVIAALAASTKAMGTLSLAQRAVVGNSTPDRSMIARGFFGDGLGTAVAGSFRHDRAQPRPPVLRSLQQLASPADGLLPLSGRSSRYSLSCHRCRTRWLNSLALLSPPRCSLPAAWC
jgi:xanthine/uracil permease